MLEKFTRKEKEHILTNLLNTTLRKDTWELKDKYNIRQDWDYNFDNLTDDELFKCIKELFKIRLKEEI